MVTEGFVKHTAAFFWPTIPPQVRGVRVHSATNSVEATLTSELLAEQPATESPSASTAAVEAKVAGAKNAEVRIEVKRPIIVDLQPQIGGVKVDYLDAKLSLLNPTTQPIDLLVPTPCDIINWEIRSADGSVVQKEPVVFCPMHVPRLVLQPGQAITEPLKIALDKEAYQTGDYVLHVSFWTVDLDTSINIQVVR